MRTVISLIAGLLLVSVTSLYAQQTPPVEPGSRVRVTAPDLAMHRQVATLEAWRGDTLVLTAERTMNCPVASVTSLDVSRGRKSNWSRGALIGGGIGVTLGAIAGATFLSDIEDVALDTGEWIALGAGAVGAGGALIGLGVGALIRTERWEEVPLDQLRVSIAQQRDGRFALGLQVKF